MNLSYFIGKQVSIYYMPVAGSSTAFSVFPREGKVIAIDELAKRLFLETTQLDTEETRSNYYIDLSIVAGLAEHVVLKKIEVMALVDKVPAQEVLKNIVLDKQDQDNPVSVPETKKEELPKKPLGKPGRPAGYRKGEDGVYRKLTNEELAAQNQAKKKPILGFKRSQEAKQQQQQLPINLPTPPTPEPVAGEAPTVELALVPDKEQLSIEQVGLDKAMTKKTSKATDKEVGVQEQQAKQELLKVVEEETEKEKKDDGDTKDKEEELTEEDLLKPQELEKAVEEDTSLEGNQDDDLLEDDEDEDK